VQQLYKICTQYWDDKYNTESVSEEVTRENHFLMLKVNSQSASFRPGCKWNGLSTMSACSFMGNLFGFRTHVIWNTTVLNIINTTYVQLNVTISTKFLTVSLVPWFLLFEFDIFPIQYDIEQPTNYWVLIM